MRLRPEKKPGRALLRQEQFGLGGAAGRALAQHPAGFTLVELLVVIAVIAILASLLLPALAQSKAQARSTVCKNHLHEMAIAMRLYTDDTKCYPYYYGSPSPAPDLPGIWFHWMQAIAPYYSVNWTNPAYHCPAYNGAILSPSFQQVDRLWGSYSYNVLGTVGPGGDKNAPLGDGLGIGMCNEVTQDTGRLDTKVTAPGETFMVMDTALVIPLYIIEQIPQESGGLVWMGSGWTGWDYAGCFFGLEGPPYLAAPSPVQHGKSFNVSYCDGHVSFVTATNLFNPTVTARNWNYDNQPHPELWP